MVAGGLILAFFFSVAHKQKELSQERLQLTLATDIENIFTGAIVSRGTAQRLPVPPQGIAFECTQGCECRFRIGNAPRDFGDKAMFAPSILKDQDITVWANELKLPYRVTNFLYLTNPNIKYYFVHDDESTSKLLLQQLAKNIPPLIEYENITKTQLTSIKEEDYQHTKFVLLNVQPATLDESFAKASVSAIRIDEYSVQFYTKDNRETTLQAGPILSYVGTPGLYAAIFSEDATMYECGMRTAFRKLSYVSKLYAERAAVLEAKAIETNKTWCIYGAPTTGNVCASTNDAEKCKTPASPTIPVIDLLCQQHSCGKILASKLDKSMLTPLNSLKQNLDAANRNYLQQSCPELF